MAYIRYKLYGDQYTQTTYDELVDLVAELRAHIKKYTGSSPLQFRRSEMALHE